MTSENAVLARLRRATVGVLLLQLLGVGANLGAQLRVAHILGPEGYGHFVLPISIVLVLTMGATLGWPTALLRIVSNAFARQEWNTLKTCLVHSHRAVLRVAALVSLGLLAASLWPQLPPALASALCWAAAFLPLACLVELRRRALQAVGGLRASVLLEQLLPSLLLLIATAALPLGILGARVAYLSSSLVVLAVGVFWLLRSLPAAALAERVGPLDPSWKSSASYILVGEIAQAGVKRLDVVLLGVLGTSMADVGLFSMAQRVAILNVILLGAINTATAPEMARSWGSGDLGTYRAVLRRGMLWSTLAALPMWFLMTCWPELVLGLAGPDYRAAATLLRILAVGQLVNAAAGPVSSALLMSGGERPYASSTAATAVFAMIAYVLAIPRWGGTGAAVVTAASTIILNVVHLVLVRSALRRRH